MASLAYMKRNVGVDFLRVLCVVYIVCFWHLFNYVDFQFDYNNAITYRLTILVLGMFIFISGYYIGRSNFQFSRGSVLCFYRKKFWRIYPLYFFALFLFFIAGLTDFYAFVKAVFALSMLLQPSPPTLWFVAMLILFYAVAPFMLYLYEFGFSYFIAWCMIVIVAMIVYSLLCKTLDIRLIIYFPAFAGGIFISKNKSFLKPKYLLYFFIFTFFVSFFKTSFTEINCFFLSAMVVAGSSFFFLVAENWVFPTKLAKMIVFLSYSSYCTYLFHRIIYGCLKKIYFPLDAHFQVLYLFVIFVPCCVFVSYMVQKKYDIKMGLLNL